jgi:hypothetical protein
MSNDRETQPELDEHVLGVIQVQYNAAQRGALTVWTIYDRPSDYPHGTMARRHEVNRDGLVYPTDHILVGELERLREIFDGAGLVKIERQGKDDPPIVETWL